MFSMQNIFLHKKGVWKSVLLSDKSGKDTVCWFEFKPISGYLDLKHATVDNEWQWRVATNVNNYFAGTWLLIFLRRVTVNNKKNKMLNKAKMSFSVLLLVLNIISFNMASHQKYVGSFHWMLQTRIKSVRYLFAMNGK